MQSTPPSISKGRVSAREDGVISSALQDSLQFSATAVLLTVKTGLMTVLTKW
jgi:hypothetical protein